MSNCKIREKAIESQSTINVVPSGLAHLSLIQNEIGEIEDFIWERLTSNLELAFSNAQGQLVGRSLLTTHPEWKANGIWEELIRSIEENQSLEFRSRILVQGMEQNFLITTMPIEGRIVVSFYNNSNLNLLEESLSQAKDDLIRMSYEYDRIFNGTQDSISLIEVGKDGCFRYFQVNDIYLKKANFPKEKIYGKTPHEVYGKDLGDTIIENYDRCIKVGIVTYQAEASFPEGRRVWETTLTPIRKNNIVSFILGSTRDITQQKKIEDELTKYRSDLLLSNLRLKNSIQDSQAANTVKDEFLRNLNHELRTPLNGVIGVSDLLYDDNLSKEQIQYLDIIRSSGKDLLRIINDMLDFSKLEGDRLRLDNASFRIEDMIQSTRSLFQARAKEQSIDLSSSISDNIPKQLYGDSRRLVQILINLIGNALKFTEVGSIRIQVDLNSIDKNGYYEIIFRVIDTGIGVPREKEHLLFKPFSQVDGSMTRRYEGTGLGLSICDRLVKLMGGRIGYDPRSGGGSEFWFTAPLQISTEKEVLDIVASKKRPSLVSQAKVLIVEDNFVNQKVARSILRKIGYDAEVAEDGKKAVQMIEERPYDLLFMDLEMPIMDGIEATIQIRELERRLKRKPSIIVAMTAHTSSEDRAVCLESGMNDYIGKPIERADMETILLKWT